VTQTAPPVIYLAGAGGGVPDLRLLTAGQDPRVYFEAVAYPGWQYYVEQGFTAERLIDELAARIIARIPRGPIRIVGLSIGGHFGYATALRLQALGRPVAGFCAIDTFMITSAGPSSGWQGRALKEVLELIRKRRFGELLEFVRSRFWRALLRLSGAKAAGLMRRFAPAGRHSEVSQLDPVLENELSMRLLIRGTAPWIAALDQHPVALEVPAVLLRTGLTAADDAAWQRRCPNIAIHEVPGGHHTLFEPEHVASLREAFTVATRDWPRE
jgi:thioesterase domain-containing protein